MCMVLSNVSGADSTKEEVSNNCTTVQRKEGNWKSLHMPSLISQNPFSFKFWCTLDSLEASSHGCSVLAKHAVF